MNHGCCGPENPPRPRVWNPEASQMLARSERSLGFTKCFISFFVSNLLWKDEWGHVEEIQLLNDGSGLGFGIVGGKTTGVVVRTLVPNSVADRVRPRSDPGATSTPQGPDTAQVLG